MSDELEPAIRQFFDATNRADGEAFLDAFAEDGTIDDWGRTFTGREAIKGWNERENIGVKSHFETKGVTRTGDEIRVAIEVSGEGYNGGGAMTFTLAGDKIMRVVITG